eukprot:403333869
MLFQDNDKLLREDDSNIDGDASEGITTQPTTANTMMPMSPIVASATVINLILATGPFSYPYAFTSLGPVLSLIILLITSVLSYISSTFIVEVISSANAVRSQGRLATLFPEQSYATPQKQMKFNEKDLGHKTSPYYIRQKIELGKLVETFCPYWIKIAVMIILVIYMYGAMCLKYASGAESFVQAVSYTIYNSPDEWTNKSAFDPYYIGIIIFGGLSLTFSFGNIENAKILQIVTGILRLIVIIFLYGGTLFYLGKDGVQAAPVFDGPSIAKNLATSFGNTVFVFIFHHSISGVVYPIRPQTQIKRMFLTSHIIGTFLLGLEGLMAFLAFSGIDHNCGGGNPYPCRVSKLFNENFVNIPFIGQVCNFYPMLNVSSVPVITITLRNNLMEMIPIKQWLSKSSFRAARFMAEDQRRIVKGLWSIILSAPVIVAVMFLRDPQSFIQYTGGLCGTFILFIIPLTITWHARRRDVEKTYGHNFNKSPFQHPIYMILIGVYAILTLSFVITGLILSSGGGGH